MIYFLQLPIGTPSLDNNTQIDLSNPFDLMMYVIIPFLIIVFYIIWKRNKGRDKN